jgi:energy-coupling factor transporter ATP-binding protein EcfA2
LTKIASEAFAEKLATTATKTFVDQILRQLSLKPTAREQKHLLNLLDDTAQSWHTFENAVAQMHLTDRRGIMFIGPSGAGKTTLMETLSRRCLPEGSTSEVDTQFTLLARRITALHDTPGQIKYWTRVTDGLEQIKPTIIVLVLADGYLDNVSYKEKLYHPEFGPGASEYRKVNRYLEGARAFELKWLQSLADGLDDHQPKNVKYCVLFINKMELWYPKTAQPYDGAAFKAVLDKLASKVSRAGTGFLSVHGSALYDGFKKKVSPVSQFGQEDSLASVRAFKALLKALLYEGRS